MFISVLVFTSVSCCILFIMRILTRLCLLFFFFFKRKTPYDLRISDWSSDVCSSDLFVHVVYGLGFTTLFFRNYYEAFPDELVKAAMIDGAGFFRIFWRILLPNSGPIIVVTVIYQFTNIWNDFLFGVSFSAGMEAPMTVALNNLVSSSTGVKEYNVHMAAAISAALPTLLVYVFAGSYFELGRAHV